MAITMRQIFFEEIFLMFVQSSALLKLGIFLVAFIVSAVAWFGLWSMFIDSDTLSAEEEQASLLLTTWLMGKCEEMREDIKEGDPEKIDCEEFEEDLEEDYDPSENKVFTAIVLLLAILGSLITIGLFIHLLSILVGVVVFAVIAFASYFSFKWLLSNFADQTSTWTGIMILISIIVGVLAGLIADLLVRIMVEKITDKSIFHGSPENYDNFDLQ